MNEVTTWGRRPAADLPAQRAARRAGPTGRPYRGAALPVGVREEQVTPPLAPPAVHRVSRPDRGSQASASVAPQPTDSDRSRCRLCDGPPQPPTRLASRPTSVHPPPGAVAAERTCQAAFAESPAAIRSTRSPTSLVLLLQVAPEVPPPDPDRGLPAAHRSAGSRKRVNGWSTWSSPRGATSFAEATRALSPQVSRHRFAIVLDGVVISADLDNPIPGVRAQIEGTPTIAGTELATFEYCGPAAGVRGLRFNPVRPLSR